MCVFLACLIFWSCDTSTEMEEHGQIPEHAVEVLEGRLAFDSMGRVSRDLKLTISPETLGSGGDSELSIPGEWLTEGERAAARIDKLIALRDSTTKKDTTRLP